MHAIRSASILSLLAAVPAQGAPRLRVLELTGTPYERGFTHGESLRTEIATLLAAWRADVAKASGLTADEFVTRFLAATSFDQAVRKHLPGLLDEVRGIAAGAGQPFDTMFAYQLVDEVWAQVPLLFRHKCSTIGVDRRGDQPAMVAQNLDLPQWMHLHPTVLRVRHSDRDLEELVVTLPGLIGANGLNNRRIAVGVNTILQIKPCRDGLPVAFLVRGILAQEDHAAALRFLQDARHASGQAYTVGGPDRAPCFECSAGKVVQYVPFAGADHTFHTNHPLVNDDWSETYLARLAQQNQQPGDLVCQRFAVLQERLADGKPLAATDLVAALSVRQPGPVCNASTYVCTVMVLGERPELRIAPGPPDRTPFQVLGFSR